MNTAIGPIRADRIVLCSGDAGPGSQRTQPGRAEYFFQHANWVGATRNSASDLGCHFVILTTGFGLVNPSDTLSPYDKHINNHRAYVTDKWKETIPALLAGAGLELLVFYAGGCPRDTYLSVARPIFHAVGLDVLTFGWPQRCDIGKIRSVTQGVISGTTVHKLRTILSCPDRLEYSPRLTNNAMPPTSMAN
jgi:hypothetical protein